MSEHNGTNPFIDITKPNEARIYDYLLGGDAHYGADRVAAEELKVTIPHLVERVRESRDFFRRAVRYLTRTAGIRQFIAVGAGLPTQDNIHVVAQSIIPDARVIYVDDDPSTVTHARALLLRTRGVQAVLDRDVFPRHREVQELIDLDRPMAILLMHPHVGETAHIREIMAPGSYLAASGPPVTFPDSCFAGLHLIEPGLVDVREWRPESTGRTKVTPPLLLGGVGHKPLPWAVAA
ncbi:SAM-dependent methyltransferase [Nonomuraea sp. NPDC050556]|uniref:SAM-dependent methyltransferase n=1 Tax=Nonomuraea sp. NPDC050556 TaxID=3364369 RepID=UPI0037B8017C